MANEKAIRAAAIALLLGVVIISYMQWGKGIDEIEPPTRQEFKTPEEIAMAAAAGKGTKARKKNSKLPGGGGWKEGEEGPEGGENVNPQGDGTMPSGAGWNEGEEGPEGAEGVAPDDAISTPAGGGWKEGEEGPEGSEGVLPDGEPASGTAAGLCWKKAKASKKFSYRFSGSVATEGFPADKGPPKEWAVVAVEQPVSKWGGGAFVKVHGMTTGIDPEFSLDLTSSEKKLHVCAVWPRTYGDFQGIRMASCLPKALAGGKDATERHGDLSLKPEPLKTQLLIISADDFGDRLVKEGMVRREISGTVEAVDVKAGSFMVAAAAGAILDEEQSQDNPRVVNLTNSSGRFDLSYVAPKDEPLFLCAMAFPKGQKPNKVKGVVGQGCTQLEIPLSAPDGVMKLIEASVKVNPEEMPLAPHELDHLSLVSRCYEGR